jgi:hypothetical protein
MIFVVAGNVQAITEMFMRILVWPSEAHGTSSEYAKSSSSWKIFFNLTRQHAFRNHVN